MRSKTSVREAVMDVRDNVSEITGIGLPCAKPLQYTIGTVDSRFNLSPDDLLVEAKEAEKIWESQSGKNLFEYTPSADFKINLIFDERQLASIEADKLAENLDQLEVAHKKITNQYENLSGTYAQKVAKYEADGVTYEKKLKEYNKKVKTWNEHGGTEDELANLRDEKNKLDDLYDKLEKERQALNDLANKTNTLVTQEQKVVKDYNTNVSTYKNSYGAGREFEKGFYDGKEINIYQFKQLTDLRLTLVHEFGHALGIGHIENPQSIMHYLLSEQDMQNIVLSKEDLNELGSVCKFK